MTSFAIQSFGCRANQAEAFQWANRLQEHGWMFRQDHSRSDFVLVNTCTVTSRADSDVRSFIRKVSRLNPGARIVLTGCYVERDSSELIQNPQIWRVFPNASKNEVVESLVSSRRKKRKTGIQPYRSRALVKIQEGCDFGCSFCIVPSVRGRSRSVDKAGILTQIRDFIDQGFREIVLTGIHINSYGKDLKPEGSLLDLIRDVENLEHLGRVRLSSLDPRFLDTSFLEYISSSKKICPHFHLSLQHGSDDVLRRMGRISRPAEYMTLLMCLRQRLPLASLGADILVGFPGESENAFERTALFLEKSPLSYFHVFSYSSRPGTAAAEWKQIDDRVKKQRALLLRKLSQKKSLAFRQNFLGKEIKAVVIKKENGGAQVLTPNYIKVHIPSCPEEEKGEVVVRITAVDEKGTRGEAI